MNDSGGPAAAGPGEEDGTMTNGTNLATLAGRALIAFIFVMAGLNKITGYDGTAAYMAAHGIPAAKALLPLVIVVELGGGVLLALGLWARAAAVALALFVVAASVVFHAFWAVPAEQMQAQMIHFMKNLAILGGLLYVLAFGPGGWSLDARRGA